MHVIDGEDVNEIYWRGMNLLRTDGRDEDSRVGPCRVLAYPVTSVYRNPTQRVLLNFKRAANPFFHLFESLWMLAGRNDVGALNRYITDFGTRFAEPNGEVHGAYGHRWRRALGFDQLDAIVERLRKNPRDRQCVLQMWDASPIQTDYGQLYYGSNDLLGDWKDRPCNTHVYFRIRDKTVHDGLVGSFTTPSGQWPVLDMMVSCRSNDIVYGAYGANAVHFSILQEYMAGRIGALVGRMTQVSWNYHAYNDVLARIGFPSNLETYKGYKISPTPMGSDWLAWDNDLKAFMSWQKTLVEAGVTDTFEGYVNKWFRNTAEPMFIAHFKWKNAMHKEARNTAMMIESEDWRFAALQWFDVRSNARSR
jgi:thymidylate synthase